MPALRDVEQTKKVAEYWTRIEKDVHAVNPAFLLIWLPYPYNQDHMQVILDRFGSPAVLVLVLDERTYEG